MLSRSVPSRKPLHSLEAFVQKGKLIHDLSKKKMSFITMWDFGGQETFAIVQHLVMSYMRCAYSIAFNASLSLDAPAASTFYEDGEEQPILRGAANRPTNFDIVAEWLDVLHHLVSLAANHSSNVLVYLIGCQIDRIPSRERVARLHDIKTDILRRIEGKPYENDVADIVFVDNTLSGQSGLFTPPDPTITMLRNEFINTMQGHSSFQSPVPLRWLPFTLAMRSLATNHGSPIVPLSTVKDVAQSVCKLRDDSEAEDLLSFYHHLGHILYFSHNDKLKRSVVVDVSWLVRVVSLLFAPPSAKFNLQRHHNFRSALRTLFQRGLLTDSLAWHIWQCYCPEHVDHLQSPEQWAYIFTLMEEFALVVRASHAAVPSIKQQPMDRLYWVPALVGVEMTEDDEGEALQSPPETESVRRSPSLFLHLVENQQMPRALFWKLVAHCLQHFQALSEEEGAEPELFRSSARIMCDQSSWLILRRYQHGLQIYVEREVQRSCAFSRKDQALLASMCQAMLTFVESSLRSVAGKIFSGLVWHRSVRCRCPFDEHPCHTHKRASCASADCHHFIRLEKPRCVENRSRKQDVSAAIFYWEKSTMVRSESEQPGCNF